MRSITFNNKKSTESSVFSTLKPTLNKSLIQTWGGGGAISHITVTLQTNHSKVHFHWVKNKTVLTNNQPFLN